MTPRIDPQALRAVAAALADAARVETLRHFRSPALAPDNKAATGFDPVTEADRASERAMRAILADRRPDLEAPLDEAVAPDGQGHLHLRRAGVVAVDLVVADDGILLVFLQRHHVLL